MNIMPTGDYYAWYCEWCDTKNLTLQQRFDTGSVSCGACHRPFAPLDLTGREPGYAVSAGF